MSYTIIFFLRFEFSIRVLNFACLNFYSWVFKESNKGEFVHYFSHKDVLRLSCPTSLMHFGEKEYCINRLANDALAAPVSTQFFCNLNFLMIRVLNFACFNFYSWVFNFAIYSQSRKSRN